MKSELISKLHQDFEGIVHADVESGAEFWLARELQELLGYAKWENFSNVLARAKNACENAGYDIPDHFLDVGKMVSVGSGAEREIADVMLTRYACYLIAQNGDPSKEAIAFAQTYFAVQTRKQEVIEQRIAEAERLDARKKLTSSEKRLSGLIFERLEQNQSFARIRSRGDQALFGGRSTQDMKRTLDVPVKRPLADFLPTITIKAKDFANEITTFNVKKDDLRTEATISREHVRNNVEVRNLLKKRGIEPENLPAEEDLKKVERRLKSEARKLPKQVDGLPHPDTDPP